MKKRNKKNCFSDKDRDCKLFISKNEVEVIWIDCGIASILLFRVDILLSSKSVQFGAQTSGAELDNKIKL